VPGEELSKFWVKGTTTPMVIKMEIYIKNQKEET